MLKINMKHNKPGDTSVKSKFGFASLRIIFNKKNIPEDFIFIEVNNEFEKLSGLNNCEILNKSAKDIYYKIDNKLYKIIDIYKEIAVNGGSEIIEHYLENTGQWYHLYIYQYKNEFLFTVINDITEIKKGCDMFDTFINVSSELLCVTDFDGRFLKTNEEWGNLLGYAKNTLSSCTIFNYIHPEDKQVTIEKYERLKNGYTLTNYINRFITTGGSFKYIEWKSRVDGEFIYSSGRVITCSNFTETSLEVGEENFKTFFNTVDDLFFVLDKNGRILKINDSVIKILGYEEKDLCGKKLYTIHPVDRWNEAKEIMERIINNELNICNIPISSKAGDIIYVESRIYPGIWNGDKCFFGVIKDVTSFIESEEKFIKAFQAGSTLMALSDIKSGIFKDVNESFLNVTGYTRTEVIGNTAENLRIFNNPNDRELVLSIARERGSVSDIELKINTKSGEVKTGLFSIKRVEVGHISCWLTSMIDITERKKAEEKLEIVAMEADIANRSKYDFLSNMSHEIRTPLNGIIGFTDLLLQTTMNEEQLQYASIINQSGKRLLEIVNDIFDYSKIESASTGLYYREVNILNLLEKISDSSRRQAELKGLNFIKNISPKVPDVAVTDPLRFRQIVTNMISNAIKFTEKGEVELKVRFREINSNTGRFDVFVRDTGIGISKENQKKLFRAFTQIDPSKSRKYGGIGLGLAISYRLAKQMGGKIEVQSEPGRGSIFHLFLDTTIVNVMEHSVVESVN